MRTRCGFGTSGSEIWSRRDGGSSVFDGLPGRRCMLNVTHLTKHFAGVGALTDASLDVRAGEIHALVGENGAGKSTLVRIVTGALSPDAGSVTYDGRALEVFSQSA